VSRTIVDLCCAAGVGTTGYVDAGHEIAFGIDVEPQPHYPYRFYHDDAMRWLEIVTLNRVNMLHASFPCTGFTGANHLAVAQGKGWSDQDDLLTPGLEILRRRFSGRIPWVVENVERAGRLMQPQEGEQLLKLCGSMFAPYKAQRHRLFLISGFTVPQPKCDHSRFEIDPESGKPRPWGVYYAKGDNIPSGGRTALDAAHAAEVLGVDPARELPWDSLKLGFQPAYTEYIGRYVK